LFFCFYFDETGGVLTPTGFYLKQEGTSYRVLAKSRNEKERKKMSPNKDINFVNVRIALQAIDA